MRSGTLISLGASALLGVGALLVAKIWLPHAGDDAAKNRPTMIATVPVVVARDSIPYGAKLEPGRLALVQYPAGSVPAGAYGSIAAAVNQAGGAPIALIPIAAREPVLPTQLSGGGAKPTVAAEIAQGMRAFTIGVTDVTGEGGHVLPGDRVDVVLTYDLSTVAGGAPGGGKRLVSDVVLQDVRVLGMDLNADPSSTQASIAHTATLEVSVKDAEKLALAAQAGTLSLALRRTGAAEIAAVPAVGIGDIGPTVRPAPPLRASLTPGRRGRFIAAPAAAARRSVIIVHGDAAASFEVPSERAGA
ncbi:MAG: Flp pilus assembly protein CpaB [Caulobacteraceae bacterium]